MSSYVSAELRRLVAQRAEGLCEYCLIHESDTFFGCQVDHIISEKHGGQTAPENLGYGIELEDSHGRLTDICARLDLRPSNAKCSAHTSALGLKNLQNSPVAAIDPTSLPFARLQKAHALCPRLNALASAPLALTAAMI